MGVSAKTTFRSASGPRLPARYQILRHIASGGMASVWCAEDRLLGRTVAVKVLAERFAHDEFAVRRFKREARTAARVSAHSYVVTIFDVGDIEPTETEIAEGHPPARAFIVMEYLAGGTVADAIRVGAVEHEEAVRWLGEAAAALDHAHQREIVHRDIKPANFLLDNNRTLHVADFGIARVQSEDTITSTGQLFGTAGYLAPEQALGREATGASDRYALAVAAFELLAGERPFSATNFAAQARQHVEDEPPRASERQPALPAAVDPILSRGMAKDPDARYETAGAFVAALKDALDSEATAVTRPLGSQRAIVPAATPAARRRAAPTAGHSGSPIVPVSAPRRNGRMVALVALLVVAAGVALVAVLGQAGSSHHGTQAASATVAHKPVRHRSRSKPKPAASSPVSASTTASAASAASASSSSSSSSSSAPPTTAAGLQAQGHQELNAGSYSTAISTLHQALSAADPSSLTYAYALYDLGHALLLSGDPKDAIPVLEQRLKIPDQTNVVQQTLDQARREAGVAPTSQSTPTPPPAKKPGHPGHGLGNSSGGLDHGAGNSSGGAGLPAKHNGPGGGD